MNYKELDVEKLHLMSEGKLRMWVKTLYKKAKQISHSERKHKHDSVFWRRQLAKEVSKEQMQILCKMIDESRKNMEA